MTVELKNWRKICEKKDQRIKELEGKFEVIVRNLQIKGRIMEYEDFTEGYKVGYRHAFEEAIEIVKEEMNKYEKRQHE